MDSSIFNLKKMTKKIIDYAIKHWLPIVFIIGGIIDQNTDLMVQFIQEINLPAWYGSLLRIIVITVGSFKLYLTKPKL